MPTDELGPINIKSVEPNPITLDPCPACAIKNRLIEELSMQLGYAEREVKNLREQIELFCTSKEVERLREAVEIECRSHYDYARSPDGDIKIGCDCNLCAALRAYDKGKER